jgi:hypothetical protein
VEAHFGAELTIDASAPYTVLVSAALAGRRFGRPEAAVGKALAVAGMAERQRVARVACRARRSGAGAAGRVSKVLGAVVCSSVPLAGPIAPLPDCSELPPLVWRLICEWNNSGQANDEDANGRR